MKGLSRGFERFFKSGGVVFGKVRPQKIKKRFDVELKRAVEKVKKIFKKFYCDLKHKRVSE